MIKTRAISSLALAISLGWTLPAHAQSAADFSKMKAQMEAMQAQLDAMKSKVDTLEGQLTQAQAEAQSAQVRVVGWRDGAPAFDEPCATGETGMVVIRGPHVSPGYSDPQRNRGMFELVPNSLPNSPPGAQAGGHWLISGDLGHIDAQGRLHITGRAKDVIIRGSHNIDPALVEEVFLAHPAVALCAVVAEPDAYAGELPVAFVTLKPGMVADVQSLLNDIAPKVYERPAVPKRVTLIDTMPMTAVGKIFKPALRLKAIEVKLAEVLEGAAPGRAIRVDGEERPGALVAVIRISGEESEAVRSTVRQRLAAISVAHELFFD